MTVDEAVRLVVPFILGGGLVSAAKTLYQARADKSSIEVGGAREAVITMGLALKAQTERAEAAEAALDRMESRCQQLRLQLDALEAEVRDYRRNHSS